MKEYKFEVGAIYTDWVLGHNKIEIVKITANCVYFRVVASDKPFDAEKVYRGKKFKHKFTTFVVERTFFPKHLRKKLEYGYFSTSECASEMKDYVEKKLER